MHEVLSFFPRDLQVVVLLVLHRGSAVVRGRNYDGYAPLTAAHSSRVNQRYRDAVRAAADEIRADKVALRRPLPGPVSTVFGR